jgi:hypothetical protein
MTETYDHDAFELSHISRNHMISSNTRFARSIVPRFSTSSTLPMRVLVVLLLSIIATTIFLLMAPYTCPHPCDFSSVARPALTRHQQHCAIYRTAQALRMEQRKIHKGTKKPVSTLECRKERIEVRVHILQTMMAQIHLFSFVIASDSTSSMQLF